MLVVSVIRKNIDQYSLGLQKRGFKEPMALLNRVIEADELRKSLQAALD